MNGSASLLLCWNRVTCGIQKLLQRYKELQDLIAILGIDALSDDDKRIVSVGAIEEVVETARTLGDAYPYTPKDPRLSACGPYLFDQGASERGGNEAIAYGLSYAV